MPQKKEILILLDQIQKQLDSIREMVLQDNFNGTSNENSLILQDYDLSASWQEKILFILAYYNKPLSSMEIVSFMDQYDKVFYYKRTELDKQKMLSTHLHRAVKKGIIFRQKKQGSKGFVYYLSKG